MVAYFRTHSPVGRGGGRQFVQKKNMKKGDLKEKLERKRKREEKYSKWKI
jgi:hypothetical protein